jgi:hypothetical protein
MYRSREGIVSDQQAKIRDCFRPTGQEKRLFQICRRGEGIVSDLLAREGIVLDLLYRPVKGIASDLQTSERDCFRPICQGIVIDLQARGRYSFRPKGQEKGLFQTYSPREGIVSDLQAQRRDCFRPTG